MIICICKNIDDKTVAKYKELYPDNYRAMLVCKEQMGRDCGNCIKYLNTTRKCATIKKTEEEL